MQCTSLTTYTPQAPTILRGSRVQHSFKKYQRAESAQVNNIEQMPLFAVAVLASILAERTAATGLGREPDATSLSTFVGAWFAVRAAYNVAYVQIADHATSFIRSGLWVLGSGLAFYQIYKAAAILG